MITNIFLYFFSWFVVMTILLTVIPKDRIPLIIDFFERILPRVPVTGIIQAIQRLRNKDG